MHLNRSSRRPLRTDMAHPILIVEVLKALERESIGAAIVGWLAFLTGRNAYHHCEHPRSAITGDGMTGGLTVVGQDLLGFAENHHLWHEDLDGMKLAMELRCEPEGPHEAIVPGGVVGFRCLLERVTHPQNRVDRYDLALAGARHAVSTNRLEAFSANLFTDPEKVRRLVLTHRPTPSEVHNGLGWGLFRSSYPRRTDV